MEKAEKSSRIWLDNPEINKTKKWLPPLKLEVFSKLLASSSCQSTPISGSQWSADLRGLGNTSYRGESPLEGKDKSRVDLHQQETGWQCSLKSYN